MAVLDRFYCKTNQLHFKPRYKSFTVMPRSHIHRSPRRFYYRLNLMDDPGNAYFHSPIRMHHILLRMAMDAIRKATDQYRLPRMQGSSYDGPDPFREKAVLKCFAKMDLIFGWAPYTSYSNLISIML